MKRIVKILNTSIGILLIFNALWLSIVSNINVGVIITLGLGIAIIVITALWYKIQEKTKAGVGKIIKYTITVGVILWTILMLFLAIYGKIDNVTYNEDAVIVLGCGVKGENVSSALSYRLDKAIEYYNKNPKAIIIVSGGKGPQENITEAEAMQKYLISKGIPENKIVKEEKSTSTTENLRYSKEILNEKFSKEYTVVVITNNFHIFRANQIAKKVGLNATHYNAKIKFNTIIPNYTRETIGIAKYIVLGQ